MTAAISPAATALERLTVRRYLAGMFAQGVWYTGLILFPFVLAKSLNAPAWQVTLSVVMDEEALNPNHPVAPLDYTKDLSCPILGLFGEEDRSPTPEQVAIHEAELKKYGKTYEFHMYPDAGHGFFYYNRPNYRQQQAVDGWEKIFAFLAKHLATA